MKNLFLLPLLFMFLTIVSCSDDEGSTVTNTVSFTSAEGSGEEDAGIITIPIELSAEAASDVTIEFELSGTAAMNGDYQVLTPSPVVVEAGTSSTEIRLQIIDDELVESLGVENSEVVEVESKDIVVELTTTSSGSEINEGSKTFTYSLVDNDVVPDNGMKMDLWWSVDGTNDIDAVDLNLLMIYDVVIEDNSITDAKFYKNSGENTTGFETLVVEPDAPDSEYYVVIQYLEGSGDVEFTFFSYKTESITYGNDTFEEPAEDGDLQIYGPITEKSGDTFSRKEAKLIRIPAKNLKLNR